MSIKYVQATEGDDGWSQEIAVSDPDSHFIACCDCGLVHEMKYTIATTRMVHRGRHKGQNHIVPVVISDLPRGTTMTIMFKARRAPRATAMKRRWMKKKGRRLCYE